MTPAIASPRPTPLWLPWRSALIAGLFALAAVAWWATDVRMGGMDMGPGTNPGTLGFYLSTWVVMMAAMMFPSVGPMVSIYSRMHRGRVGSGAARPVATLLAGYLPQPVRLSDGRVAGRALGRSADGRRARRVVRRLLLGADGVAALIALEKLLPWRAAATATVTAMLLALAGDLSGCDSCVPRSGS